MHSPRAFGRFAGQVELSERDAAAVEQFARTFSNFKAASDLPTLKRSIYLPSGRIATAIDAGGVFRIVIDDPRDPEDPRRTDGTARADIPMLFSGAITQASVREGQGVGLKLTLQARRRLVGYQEDAGLPPSDLELMRFRVEYPQKFKYFEPAVQGIYTATQYAKLRPTWYSGAMTEVMQVVSGYGSQDFESLPNMPLERARMKLPEKWRKQVERELGNVRLPGYAGMPEKSGQFVYDYKAALCHGVGFDTEHKPWLLRVDQRGVFAMPLPMIPATMTDAFREYMEEVADSEILQLIERFGGLPSGESFPEDEEDFEAWRRAGVIVKVCDCADFYSHQSMYEACGWSFNSKGTEAYNTCREWNGQHWLAHGYIMSLSLQSARLQGKLPESWNLEEPEHAAALNAYLSGIYMQLSDSPRALAIKYKLRRFSGEQLLSLARSGKANADYWDSLEVEPIAAHSGNVARVNSGNLWHPGRVPTAFGAIKFPELRGRGCQSIDVTAPDYTGPAVRCDTVVFGCYVKDQLRTIKYFYEPRETKLTEKGDFEDLMIVGSWEKTTTVGMTGLDGKVYTTDADDRRQRSSSVTTTKLIGKDMGYGEPAWHTPGLLARVGTLSRARYYEHRTEVTTETGQSLVSGAVVPVFARDCIVYAVQKGTEQRTESVDTALKAIVDPTSYEFWTHDELFHYIGVTAAGNLGVPRPKDGAPVWLDTMNYTEAAGSDFADSGDWLGFSPPMDVTGVVGPYTARNSAHNANGVVVGGAPPGWEEFHSKKQTQGQVTGSVQAVMPWVGPVTVHQRRPDDWYFLLSPVDAGGPSYFYREACWNACGKTDFVSLDELDDQGKRKTWGQSAIASTSAAQHFLGVINE